MKSIIKDDRTEEQAETLTAGVLAHDPGMSGWGHAEGLQSWACWACTPDNADKVAAWVEGRGDMGRVKVIDLDTFSFDKTGAHVHIYAATDTHPSTQ